MNKSFLQVFAAAAAVLASFSAPGSALEARKPAAQKAFPSLTTIYLITGVRDNGGAAFAGTATTVQCSNVSGSTVSLRVLALNEAGAPAAQLTLSLPNGVTRTISTHFVNAYTGLSLNTGAIGQGVINVEATNPAVFCSAFTISAANTVPVGVNLHIVRVNAQPGTLELRAAPPSQTAARRKAFPNLTTIYVATGVRDSGNADNSGIGSVVHCSNVSGSTQTVRVLILRSSGAVEADQSITFAHGQTKTFGTKGTLAYNEDVYFFTGVLDSGVFNIESTSPAVFCSAAAINAGDAVPVGVNLRMIRVNPLSGTQE